MSIIWVGSSGRFQAATNVIVSSGLVVHLDPGTAASYPGTGTTITDLTGGNNGTFDGAVTYSASNGGTLQVGAGRIVMANMGSHLNGVNQFTISTYFNTSGANRGIFSYGAFDTYNTDTFLFFNNGTINMQVNNGTDGGWSWPASSAVWQFATIIYDGTLAAANRLKLYINATLVTPSSSSYTIPTVTATIATPLSWLAGYASVNNNGFALTGSIGPFMLYSRAISAEENLQNFNVHRARFSL